MRISDWSSDVCSSDLSGEIRIACSVRTLTTGIDWPVACIVDAAPTRSEMLHVQKIGRGLRVNPPWEDCIILDHSDNTLRLGMATDIHHGTLDDGKPKPAAERERKAPLPKECGACGFIKPGSEERRVGKECGRPCRYRGAE